MTKFTDREQIRKVAGEQLKRPLCHWGDQPKLTAAQVDALLGNCSSYVLEQAAKGDYKELICNWNAAGGIEDVPVTTVYGFEIGATVYSTNKGWGFTTGFGPYIVTRQAGNYVGMECGAIFPPDYLTTDETLSAGYVPPKPKFLPIERPVRVADLEAGDILRFCYEDTGTAPHDGYALLGSEVVFKRVSKTGDIVYRCTNGRGDVVEDQHCPAKLFSFVRRPGYVKPKKPLPYGVALVKEDRTKWAVGDILRVIEGDRYEHQGPGYLIDGEDYIIVGIYKNNGVSDVRVRLYNGNRHDATVKSGSRQQFKFVRPYDDKDGWILRENPQPAPSYYYY